MCKPRFKLPVGAIGIWIDPGIAGVNAVVGLDNVIVVSYGKMSNRSGIGETIKPMKPID